MDLPPRWPEFLADNAHLAPTNYQLNPSEAAAAARSSAGSWPSGDATSGNTHEESSSEGEAQGDGESSSANEASSEEVEAETAGDEAAANDVARSEDQPSEDGGLEHTMQTMNR